MSSVICAEASNVKHIAPKSGFFKRCSSWKSPRHVRLVKEKDSKYYLNFYEAFDDDRVKCSHRLHELGHNFIHTIKQTDIRASKFYLFAFENPQQPFLILEVSEEDKSGFGSKLKTKLNAHSYLINVFDKNNKFTPCIIHITSRRLCVTVLDPEPLKFIVPPMDIATTTIEMKARPDIDLKTKLILDNKFYKSIEFTINHRDHNIILLFKTSQVDEIYKSLTLMMNKANLTCDISFDDTDLDSKNDTENKYEPYPIHEHSKHHRRVDRDTNLPVLTPEKFDEIQSNGTKSPDSENTDPNDDDGYARISELPLIYPPIYGSTRRKRPRIYTYIDIIPPLKSIDKSSPYEFIKLKDNKSEQATDVSLTENISLEFRELQYTANEETSKENELLKFYISVFASKPQFDNIWLVVIILTREESDQSFERIRKMETDSDHHQLSACRPVNTKSDVKFRWNFMDKHSFKLLSDEVEDVSYDDLNKLSSKSWILFESQIQCTCTNMPKKQFVGNLNVTSDKNVNISVMEEFIAEARKPINCTSPFTAVVFPLPPKDRRIFCEKLDMRNALGDDWKCFADHMGLTQHEIRVIENSRLTTSYTELTIRTVESRFPEKCDYIFIKNVLEEMRRRDLSQLIVECNEHAVENDG